MNKIENMIAEYKTLEKARYDAYQEVSRLNGLTGLIAKELIDNVMTIQRNMCDFYAKMTEAGAVPSCFVKNSAYILKYDFGKQVLTCQQGGWSLPEYHSQLILSRSKIDSVDVLFFQYRYLDEDGIVPVQAHYVTVPVSWIQDPENGWKADFMSAFEKEKQRLLSESEEDKAVEEAERKEFIRLSKKFAFKIFEPKTGSNQE